MYARNWKVKKKGKISVPGTGVMKGREGRILYQQPVTYAILNFMNQDTWQGLDK